MVRAVHGGGCQTRGQAGRRGSSLGAQGSGHVGLYVGEDYGAYHVLGGNQSDGVTITRIARDRCITIRRPAYRKEPASAKPVQLAARDCRGLFYGEKTWKN